MFKKIAVFLLLLMPVYLQAQTLEQKRHQLLKILDEELSEVSRLNKQTAGRNPNLVLRMAEIILEKARHVKEMENGKYLSLSPNKRKKVNKRAYFRRSTQLFIKAQKTCYYILKRYKRFKGRGDVYYILAYNAKEFQKTKKARGFFQKAIKYSKRGSKTRVRSATALAEILYNEGKYKKAIPLYEMALKRSKNMWWTKDSHNLAWCYFKTGKKSKAIKKMKKIYELSKSKKYIDMSYNVERDIAFFYADTKRISEAITFFKSNGKSISKNLLKVSKYLINQGKFTSAEKTLAVSKKYNLSIDEKIEVNIALLNLYERFGKTKKHLKASRSLFSLERKGKLKSNDKKDLTYHIEKKAALLQKQSAGKTYAGQSRIRKSKANLAADYYEMLAVLRPKDDFKSFYYAAEALYASKQYNRAIEMYSKAQASSTKRKNKKYMNLSNTGVLVTLGKKGVSKSNIKKYLIPSYLLFIKNNPRTKESHRIYQRLFSAYYAKNDIVRSEKTLNAFRASFPKDQKIQEAMMAKIMDHYRAKKDKKKISEWVKRINKGEFSVSKKYAKRLQYILMTMQFENAEKANSKGDKRQALKYYISIYKSDESTADAKKNAAYNLAVLFFEYGDLKRSYNWLERAMKHMNGKDVAKFSSSILAISNSLLESGYFPEAAKVSTMALAKVCKRKLKIKQTFFKNATLIYLADHKYEKTEGVIKDFRRCGIHRKTIHSIELNLVKYYQDRGMWLSYEKKLLSLELQKKFWVDLIQPTFLLSKNYKKAARDNLAKEAKKKALRFYRYAKRKSIPIPLEALDEVAKLELAKLDIDIENFYSFKLRFPEKTFRKLMERKLKKLDKLTSKAISILKIGSGLGISISYRKLIEIYNRMASDLKTFKLPASKNPEYVKAFKKNMDLLADPFLQKAKTFKKEATHKISSQLILSPYNNLFFADQNEIDIFYFPITNGVLMDRGGQR